MSPANLALIIKALAAANYELGVLYSRVTPQYAKSIAATRALITEAMEAARKEIP